MRRFTVLAASIAMMLVAVLASASSQAATQGRWVIRDLGTLGGSGCWPDSEAMAINDRGQIVGTSCTKPDNEHGFLWENDKMRDLGTLGGPESSAVAINERGQVVGEADTKTKNKKYGYSYGHAFLWQNGKMTDLGTLGELKSEALALNDRGQILVLAATGGSARWFLWEKGRRTELDIPGGDSLTDSAAINERGQVVGRSDSMNAFLWQGGKARELGTLPGYYYSDAVDVNDAGVVAGTVSPGLHGVIWTPEIRSLGKLFREPYDINERGWVAGGCQDKRGRAIPCLWRDGKVVALPIVFGDRGKAVAVNNRGQVVGFTMKVGVVSPGVARRHASVWEKGKTTDLGTLGGRESEAVAINERGQIVGWADAKSHGRHAVLWTYKP